MNFRFAERQGGHAYVYLVAFVASVGGFLFGYDLVIISGAQLFLQEEFGLSGAQLGFATSSAVLGCIAGPFLGALLCDRLGRRNALILAAFLFGVSAIGTSLPKDITTFNIFRIIGGVGVGLASIASPMYITEVAPAKVRGALVILYQLAITIGCTMAVVVSYFLALHLDEDVAWRWMFASEMVPILIFVFLLLFVPKSPRWLAEMGRYEEASAVLSRITDHEHARSELDEIKHSLAEETGTFSELFQPGIRKALLIGILLALFNNWTGWSGIAYYLPTLFQRSGFAEKSDAIFQSLIINVGTVFLTVLAILLVDRVGRRPLWIFTSAAMAFSLVLTSLVFHYNITGMPIVFVIFMCAGPHAVGLGPLPWLMMSEIQPTRIRAKAVAISTTFLWIAGFTGPMCYPILVDASEREFGSIMGVFLLYAIICVGALIFGCFLLPETKNKSLEEIAGLWLKKQ